MSTPENHINYLEFKAKDLEEIKQFYTEAFGWAFTDYGPNYVSFADSGIAGGFEKTEKEIRNGVLVVIYHSKLESAREAVLRANGKISVDIFSFPGGRRFQFLDPSGNEVAVWAED